MCRCAMPILPYHSASMDSGTNSPNASSHRVWGPGSPCFTHTPSKDVKWDVPVTLFTNSSICGTPSAIAMPPKVTHDWCVRHP